MIKGCGMQFGCFLLTTDFKASNTFSPPGGNATSTCSNAGSACVSVSCFGEAKQHYLGRMCTQMQKRLQSMAPIYHYNNIHDPWQQLLNGPRLPSIRRRSGILTQPQRGHPMLKVLHPQRLEAISPVKNDARFRLQNRARRWQLLFQRNLVTEKILFCILSGLAHSWSSWWTWHQPDRLYNIVPGCLPPLPPYRKLSKHSQTRSE